MNYEWIRKWGHFMGSNASYIQDQVDQAEREHAPQNAIYRNQEGGWRTTDDITNRLTRHALGLDR